MKKMLCSLWLLGLLGLPLARAESFPAYHTAVDGQTRAGYLNEKGEMVLPFRYAEAEPFGESGLAAVRDLENRVAVIDEQGRVVIDYVEAPTKVEYQGDEVALRYPDHTVFYSKDGTLRGSYAGAVGFFEDGLLLTEDAQGGYQYCNTAGELLLSQKATRASVFSGGLALIEQDGRKIINTAGEVVLELPQTLYPKYFTLFEGNYIVVWNENKQCGLYSVREQRIVGASFFENMSELHEGEVMVQQDKLWGMMNRDGVILTTPRYHYLSYLGEGLYSARGNDGTCTVVDADGNQTYRTDGYVGGMESLRYGVSWHGTRQGTLIFFGKNGGFLSKFEDAERPEILSPSVVRLWQGGALRYYNLYSGQELLVQPTSFSLSQGLSIHSSPYEKFLGYDQDGQEYGWQLTLPALSGLRDSKVQQSINTQLRSFFLKGPAGGEKKALSGSYGAAIYGSVLTVWANAQSGTGEGATLWCDSIALDLRTGAAYTIDELMKGGYSARANALLPSGVSLSALSSPRVSADSITYFSLSAATVNLRPTAKPYALSLADLGDSIDRQSAYYRALQTPYSPTIAPTTTQELPFADLAKDHWAYSYVEKVYAAGLMQGDGVKFRPEDTITTAEVSATLVRVRSLPIPDELPQEIDAEKWYAGEFSAALSAGLFQDMAEVEVLPEQAIRRADAMRLFANLLIQDGKTQPSADEQKILLAGFADAAEMTEQEQQAAALCIREGLIIGANGKLSPTAFFTRAQFAKILSLLILPK